MSARSGLVAALAAAIYSSSPLTTFGRCSAYNSHAPRSRLTIEGNDSSVDPLCVVAVRTGLRFAGKKQERGNCSHNESKNAIRASPTSSSVLRPPEHATGPSILVILLFLAWVGNIHIDVDQIEILHVARDRREHQVSATTIPSSTAPTNVRGERWRRPWRRREVQTQINRNSINRNPGDRR